MNSWKSSSLPACGVAVISSRCRVMPPEQLAELVALGLLQLGAEVVRRHPVRLVDHDQVPVGLIRAIACRSSVRDSWSIRAISSGILGERVARRWRPRSSSRVRISNASPNLSASSSCHCSTRLARGDDQAPLQVTAEHQLLDVQPGHDRLAGARDRRPAGTAAACAASSSP